MYRSGQLLLNMGAWGNRICFVLVLSLLRVSCYEKTLRKIVRNQSKMVRRPFSDMGGGVMGWRNSSVGPNDDLIFTGTSQGKKKIHKMQRPKLSSMLSSADSRDYSKKAYIKVMPNKHEKFIPLEQRLTRNSVHSLALIRTSTEGVLFPDRHNIQIHFNNESYPEEIAVDTFYEIPPQSNSKVISKASDPDRVVAKDHFIVIPNNTLGDNDSSLIRGIFIANSKYERTTHSYPTMQLNTTMDIDNDDVEDFLIQGKTVEGPRNSPVSQGCNNTSSLYMYTCTVVEKSKADIDVQETFGKLDIEPNWMSNKRFWNNIYENRYEKLMRSVDWPPLKVILIPRTHVDSIWKNTFHRYHNDSVHRILTNVVKKLHFYENLTFSWDEVSHLSQWWKTTTPKSRSVLRRLLKKGRIEITTGAWVATDEATSHIFGLLHQLIEGHQWLKTNLNYVPETAWLTNSVTHSPTMAYLLAGCGVSNIVLTNLHYAWEQFLAEYQYSDFIWLQNWKSDSLTNSRLNIALDKIGTDRLPRHSTFAHFLQFNSAGFKACGPNETICVNNFNFAKSNNVADINSYNIKERAELLLEQYSKTGTLSPHNIIMAPLGGPFDYEKQSDFDYQYNNYQKIAEFVNANSDIYKATIEFGVPKDYFDNVFAKHKSYPTIRGDFINFADLNDGRPAYWSGYFTSRPLFKILLRQLQSTLRSTEILTSFALSSNSFRNFGSSNILELLQKIRELFARLQDRNVVSGTLPAHVLRYTYRQTVVALKNCWYIQEVATSLLSLKPDKTINASYFHKYVYREGEIISLNRPVEPGDQVYVFNPLNHERTEVIELLTRNPNLLITDYNKKGVTIQVNPIWKYTSDNFIKISRRFFKVTFAIVIPPLTLELYKIKETSKGKQNVANLYCGACIVEDVAEEVAPFPFTINAVESGDILLESYKQRLVIDERTGFLKQVTEKVTGIEKNIVIDYGAFRSSHINSGMFLFNTNFSKPLQDILMPYRIGSKTKTVFIISGLVCTELTTVFGTLLQSTVRIYNLMNSPLSSAVYLESRVDYELSPKNKQIEMFMSIETDISNGNPPQIFTDNNGFQYMGQILNVSRRIESNMFAMTTMSYIQDYKQRATVITDHAQGVSALQEGQLIIMLDRRVLYNDGRGANEGLADSSVVSHRHMLLLENFATNPNNMFSQKSTLQLPSLSAIQLANSLTYSLDLFLIDRNNTDLCYFAFLPLVKSSFPCDITLLNYRVVFNRGNVNQQLPNTALMILHKQSMSCQIDYDVKFHCSGDSSFSLDKILNGQKAIYQTNLCGTDKGTRVKILNEENFPPMELITLRIHF